MIINHEQTQNILLNYSNHLRLAVRLRLSRTSSTTLVKLEVDWFSPYHMVETLGEMIGERSRACLEETIRRMPKPRQTPIRSNWPRGCGRTSQQSWGRGLTWSCSMWPEGGSTPTGRSGRPVTRIPHAWKFSTSTTTRSGWQFNRFFTCGVSQQVNNKSSFIVFSLSFFSLLLPPPFFKRAC